MARSVSQVSPGIREEPGRENRKQHEVNPLDYGYAIGFFGKFLRRVLILKHLAGLAILVAEA